MLIMKILPLLMMLLMPGYRYGATANVADKGLNLNWNTSSTVEVLPLEGFGKLGKIALHFPCKESNMFATNCACHLRCHGQDCSAAIKLCTKYQPTLGCKYVLLRGYKNKIATLKRAPTPDELSRISISDFKSPMKLIAKQLAIDPKKNTVEQLVLGSGSGGAEVVTQLQSNTKKKNKYCPRGQIIPDEFKNGGIAIVLISYRAPYTVLNTVRSWAQSGLLDMVQEKIALLSDPLVEEVNIATWYGFTVVQPNSIPKAKMVKENVFTIGAAFYYALQTIQSKYLLFMENDFKMDVDLSQNLIKSELVASMGLLDKGAEIVRLLSRKSQGCGTFKDCDHHSFHFNSKESGNRVRNWFAFYCLGKAGTEDLIDDCLDTPMGIKYRCFTSWDSNWSLNAALMKRDTMLHKVYPSSRGPKSMAEIGLSHWDKQDGFESDMVQGSKWMDWRVPICISYNGLFIHEEIETGA